MIYALIFCISLIRVFARALQQLSVVNFHWLRIPLVSYLMSYADYFQWGVAGYYAGHDQFWTAAFAATLAGTGGFLGTYLAMWLHKETT